MGQFGQLKMYVESKLGELDKKIQLLQATGIAKMGSTKKQKATTNFDIQNLVYQLNAIALSTNNELDRLSNQSEIENTRMNQF